MVSIEKGVPIPDARTNLGKSKYKFNEMEVGDSFFVEGVSLKSSPYQLARDYAKSHGKRFTGRKVEGGIRIWRVE